MRLIDADALPIKDLDSNGWLNAFGVALEDIENAPTIDAVSVVRCGECRFYIADEGKCTRSTWTYDWHRPKTNADDFCSYAERSDT